MKYILQSRIAKISLGVAGIASADTAASITSAFTSANASMTTVVTGVIALAAIVTGVGLIYRFLTK